MIPSRNLFLRAANPVLGTGLTVTVFQMLNTLVRSLVLRTIKQHTFNSAEIKAIDRGQEWVGLGFNNYKESLS